MKLSLSVLLLASTAGSGTGTKSVPSSSSSPKFVYFRGSGAAYHNINDDQCSSVKEKVDCGHVGTTQPDCEASGCCWTPAPGTSDPWCYHKAGDVTTCPLNHTSTGSAPFSQSEVETMRGFFKANINIDGSGAVVASPDTSTPGGSYYFHWERDAALSMQTLLNTAASVQDVKTEMDAYVKWVGNVQSQPDPHGQSVLAEPKYLIPSGQVFPGPWCRPQNDGPGLRSHTLIDYANALSAASMTQEASDDLWPLIQKDLDWAASNTDANGCDLWEEIQSNDFFWNKFTMRAALTKGSAFAKQQGDQTRSDTYINAAQQIEQGLSSHFVNGMVIETQARQKDAAVICAFNDGYLGDGVFSPSGKEAAGTVAALNELFCSTFQINQDDTKNGVPGILYGRYEGDTYAGGNPWILLTSALAELLYHGATEIVTNGPGDYSHWAQVLGMESNADSESIAQAMVGAGDGVLLRLRSHVADGGFHLTEQLDRNTGTPMAASDLTWSYATTLKAMHARAQFESTVSQ